MQVFTRDIVHDPKFLRGPAVAQVEFFSSGMVAVQMLARSLKDVEEGDIGGFTRRTVYYGSLPARTV